MDKTLIVLIVTFGLAFVTVVCPGTGRPRTPGSTAKPFLPPAGPRAQGWTGKCKTSHHQCLAEAVHRTPAIESACWVKEPGSL